MGFSLQLSKQRVCFVLWLLWKVAKTEIRLKELKGMYWNQNLIHVSDLYQWFMCVLKSWIHCKTTVRNSETLFLLYNHYSNYCYYILLVVDFHQWPTLKFKRSVCAPSVVYVRVIKRCLDRKIFVVGECFKLKTKLNMEKYSINQKYIFVLQSTYPSELL